MVLQPRTARACVCAQAACRALMDLLACWYQDAMKEGFPLDYCQLPHHLLARLLAAPLEPTDWQYFGLQVFCLAEAWLSAQFQGYQKEDFEEVWVNNDTVLGLVPEAYLTMLGELEGCISGAELSPMQAMQKQNKCNKSVVMLFVRKTHATYFGRLRVNQGYATLAA